MERPQLRRTDPTDTRSVSRVLRLALVLSVAFAAVLLSLLALASINNSLFQQHYGLLLWLNIGVAVALAVLAIELARRLMQRFRQRLFGTRLMARLALAFVLMTSFRSCSSISLPSSSWSAPSNRGSTCPWSGHWNRA